MSFAVGGLRRLNMQDFWRSSMDKIKPLFTATATATGGRNGHTEAADGSVKADLSVPKAMGGPGKPGTTTPELRNQDLFHQRL
jgi:organic hydroperoxide reductase OsmC/OhrA